MTSEQLVTGGETRIQAQESTDSHYLSREETRQILTPFAFEIDKSLFGIALAAPWKRGVALLIDLFLIASLAEMPGEVLALVLAITVFRLGSKKRAQSLGKTKGKKRRAMMRLLGAFIVFVVLVSTLPDLLNGFDSETDVQVPESVVTANGKELTGIQSIEFAALVIETTAKISNSRCESVSCWQQEFNPMIDTAIELKLKQEMIKDALSEIVAATGLAPGEQQELRDLLLQRFRLRQGNNAVLADEAGVEAAGLDNKALIAADRITKENIGPNWDGTIDEQPETKEEDKAFYSIMQWVKGIIQDLGLEFGWAAFYFTAFTALWRGQTPGKKLLRIKVLQLDGTPLSLSDSFGRYGGYGAGIATGLLGFLQIYWDPNRQAIHDKISATVVIDLNKQEQAQKKSKK